MTSNLNIEKIAGTGTPIIFIHGWMGSKEVWSQVRENIELDNPLIFYDQRCHGQSKCSEFSIEDLARDLEKITQDLDEPILVGHSMGGMTSLKYSTLSENFSGLLIFASSASTPETDYKSPEFIMHQIKDAGKEKINEILTDKTENNQKSSDNIFTDIGLNEIIETDKKPLIYGLNAMRTYNIQEDLEDERALVVAGESDRVIPSKQSKKVAELLNCEFKLIDSSHLMLQEEPEKIADITENFVKNL